MLLTVKSIKLSKTTDIIKLTKEKTERNGFWNKFHSKIQTEKNSHFSRAIQIIKSPQNSQKLLNSTEMNKHSPFSSTIKEKNNYLVKMRIKLSNKQKT
jgi:hypothetical protein